MPIESARAEYDVGVLDGHVGEGLGAGGVEQDGSATLVYPGENGNAGKQKDKTRSERAVATP